MKINISAIPKSLLLPPKLSSFVQEFRIKTFDVSSKLVSRLNKQNLKNNFNDANSLEFLVVSIVNYKFYVYKLSNPSSPKIISHSIIEIPATCLGDSDITRIDEYSEIILSQILGQDPTLKLPATTF